MSNDNRTELVRTLVAIGLDSTTIAEQIGTTPENLRNIAKRNSIKLNGVGTGAAGVVCEIPIGLIMRDPEQPRKQFDEEQLAELAASLKNDGQQTPIRFRVSPETAASHPGGAPLMVVHGERRCKAALLAGLPSVLGVLDTTEENDSDRLLRQVADNAQRADLTTWDWVETIEQLHAGGMKIAEISDAITARGIKGFSRPVVSNLRRLRQLPPTGIELIKAGKITAAHGKYLLACKDADIAEAILADLVDAETAWTIDALQRNIHWLYQKRHRGLHCWTHNGFGRFHPSSCDDCQFRHKAGEDEFCTDPDDTCWNRKQEESTRPAPQHSDDDAEPEGADLETLRETDPEEAARIERMKAEREESLRIQRQRTTERDMRAALKAKATDQVAHCEDLDTLIVLALEPLLTDWDLVSDEDPLNLTQWRERCAINRLDMLRMLARETLTGYVDPDALAHVARMLDIDPEADYREPEPQTDIEEHAA